MKKKSLSLCLLALGVTGLTMFSGSSEASAHGYVNQPASRVVNAKANGFGWGPGEISSHPEIISTPQGVEAATADLDSGKLNGKLASAGLDVYSPLNEQTSSRWVKNPMSTGENNFNWHHTAVHKTNRYRYYMTKQGWNQNEPLTLKNMDLIKVIGQPIGEDFPKGEGFTPAVDETQQVNIPSDRSGYHVVYAVWDINDTINSFYQAIDVNVK